MVLLGRKLRGEKDFIFRNMRVGLPIFLKRSMKRNLLLITQHGILVFIKSKGFSWP